MSLITHDFARSIPKPNQQRNSPVKFVRFNSHIITVLCCLIVFVSSAMTISINLTKQKNLITPANQNQSLNNKELPIQENKLDQNNLHIQSVQKREAESARRGATWYEYQMHHQGVWWTDWEPASCVHQNSHGSTPYSVSLIRAVSHRATYGPRFSVEFGIRSTSEYGHETSKTNIISENAWYMVPAYGYGQVWSQQMMIWQDQQHRICTKHEYGPNGVTCGPWSEYIRGNLPVIHGVNFVWKTDWKVLDFNLCGGGS